MFECLRTGRKSWVKWITIITILRDNQWGYTPYFGMRMIGKREVDSSKWTGVNPLSLHPSATSMLLLLLLALQRRIWTPTKSRRYGGCEITIWYTIIVLTPRGSPRGHPLNENEPSNQLHRLFDEFSIPCHSNHYFIPCILFYDLHSFIVFQCIH